MPGLRLGHPLHVQAGQRRGFAAALLLQRLEFMHGLIELLGQAGLVALDLVEFVGGGRRKTSLPLLARVNSATS